MGADGLSVNFFGFPSTEYGVMAVLLALVRKTGRGVSVFVPTRHVRWSLLHFDHKHNKYCIVRTFTIQAHVVMET